MTALASGGGDIVDRVLNLGGSIGNFVGTDLFTNGFKVEKPETFNDLIKTIDENKGCLWGLVLFAHGTQKGNLYSSANWTKTSTAKFEGNVDSVIASLKSNGFKIAKAYPSQCFSLYKGKVQYKKAESKTYETEVDWDARWREVSIFVHGYYGVNAAWLIDTGSSGK